MRYVLSIILVFSGIILWSQEQKSDTIKSKSGYTPTFKLGGVGNKEALMAKDDYLAPYYRWDLTFSTHWFDLKRKLNEKTGIQFAVNYSSTFIGASKHVSEESQRTAFSGNLDITIKSNFINRKKDKNKGSLIFWMDSRHLYYGEVAPAFFFQVMMRMFVRPWMRVSLQLLFYRAHPTDPVVSNCELPLMAMRFYLVMKLRRCISLKVWRHLHVRKSSVRIPLCLMVLSNPCCRHCTISSQLTPLITIPFALRW
jgi:hypothetical protein